MDFVSVDPLLSLVRKAGERILEIYSGDFQVEYKPDDSPVTLADRASHQIVTRGLAGLHPDVPVISEEGEHLSYAERQAWRRVFLLDPLDGTKEFVKRNGEFTVNLALVEDGRPRLGIIYFPVADLVYFGGRTLGSYKRKGAEPLQPISTRKADKDSERRVVVTRSHPSPQLTEFLSLIRYREVMHVGSAYKFCLVAEGVAQLYPRMTVGPYEWDIAAGHAIVEGAGGTLNDLEGRPLRYNKEDLRSGPFIVSA